MDQVSYFKTGATVTVEAAANGFILHTEDGSFIAGRVEDVIAGIITSCTNHAHFVAQQKAAEAQGAGGEPELDIGNAANETEAEEA